MPPTRSRYGGHADWYDSWNKPNAERNATDPLRLLGPGDGLCLDVGCGSGYYFDVPTAAGGLWSGWTGRRTPGPARRLAAGG